MGLRKVTILTEGTTSYTPFNSEALYIECFGAGGGGGGASAVGISGGGGAGSFSSVVIPSGSVSLTPYTISVGAGGPGGLGNATRRDSNTGSIGGDTFFDSASFCLAKGGAGGQGAASPKGGAGGFADDGVGDQRTSGASGTVGFRYVDFTSQRQAQSGDGAGGFFGGGGEGINSKIIDHPSARDALAFGAGGSGASDGRGGSGSAGLIKIWEYGILNAPTVISGAGSFWSPVSGTVDNVLEIIAARDFDASGPLLVAGDPNQIDFAGQGGFMSNAGEGATDIAGTFNTGSDWAHTIFVVVKPFISHSTSIINFRTENLDETGSVGIYLNDTGLFEYIVHPANFTGSVASAFGTQVSASADVIAATGTITFDTIADADTEGVTVGGKDYTFQTSLTNVDGNVLIGANVAEMAANFIAAVNLDAGSGTKYAASMTVNPLTTATAGSGTIVILTAKAGSVPNSIDLARTDGSIWTISGPFLTDGLWGNVWQTIAYTVGPDGLEKQKAYKNGLLVATVSKSFDINVIQQGDNIHIAGNDNGSLGATFHEFTGSMAYLGWWPRELTQEEIAVVHNWVVTDGGFGSHIS